MCSSEDEMERLSFYRLDLVKHAVNRWGRVFGLWRAPLRFGSISRDLPMTVNINRIVSGSSNQKTDILRQFLAIEASSCSIIAGRKRAKVINTVHLSKLWCIFNESVSELVKFFNRQPFLIGSLGIIVSSAIRAGSVSWIKRSFPQLQTSPDGQRDSKNSQGDQDKEPNEEEKMPFSARVMLMMWLAFIVYIFLNLSTPEEMVRYVSWNEFIHDILAKGEVELVMVRPEVEMAYLRLYPGAVIKGQKADDGIYAVRIPEIDKFEEKLRKAEEDLGIKPNGYVPIAYQREVSWLPQVLAIAGLCVVMMILRNVVKLQLPNPSEMFARERKANFIRVDLLTPEGKGITFKDVAGLHEAKIEVMEFVDYLKKPENYRLLGAKVPKGALLLGPPGCGKTLLAKAVATEARVPFLAMAGSEFVEMLGGLGAARVRDLFQEARKRSPCIVYIDEVDAIGRNRSGNNWVESSEEEHTLNQLLVEMDGIGTKEGVIVLASTNRAEILDKALLRPGRFDRHILIDFPTLLERMEIFEIYLKRLRLARPVVEYSETLAQLSPGMSGADIANICNEAALHAARNKNASIDTGNFEYAVERVTAGVAKKSRILSPQEKKIVAYHEAGHALVGWLLRHTDALIRVSIVPRTNQSLGYAQYMPNDRKLLSQEMLFEEMCLVLGGRVAESITFNSSTSGAQDDLKTVTDMAYKQIRNLGLNERLGLVAFPAGDTEFGGKPYSRQTAMLIDDEARVLIANAYKFTEKLLLDNKEKLRMVAEALLERESLSYKEMEQLIGPPPFEKKFKAANWRSMQNSNATCPVQTV